MTDETSTAASTGPDVFISYAREDREVAEQLAEALAAEDLKVWWDREILAGSEFSSVIESQLGSARVVVALWSEASVRSAFVRDESSRALRSGKLLPVRIEDVELPLGFGQIHTLDLLDWDGDTDVESFRQLVGEVQRRKAGLVRGVVERRSAGRWRLRPFDKVVVVVATLVILAFGATLLWQKRASEDNQRRERIEAERKAERSRAEADRHFRAGLEHQFAPEPELVPALNEYLSALEYRPGHARAHYYLAHVYAQLGKLGDALASFKLALTGTEAPLDNSLRAEANRQVAALSANPDEATPVARSLVQPPPPKPIDGASRPQSSGKTEKPQEAKKPPPSNPPAVMLTRLATLVDGMFDENKEKRIASTTSLVVDPDALSDAVPLAITKALAVLRDPSPAELSPGDSSGVVNTLVLLQSAMPSTLEVHRSAVEELLAATRPLGTYTREQAAKVSALLKAAATRSPVAYIQIANEAQRPVAQAMAARFRKFGYETPAVDVVGNRAPAHTEVRLQGKSERSFARWVAKVVGELSGEVPAVSTLRSARPTADSYEIWLGRDVCAPSARKVPACTASSS